MVGSLLEAAANAADALQAAASENVQAFGNIPAPRIILIQRNEVRPNWFILMKPVLS
jgi:hypothetical protein